MSFKDRPDMYGKVKDILGNEVTLELAETPESNDRSEMSQEEREDLKSQMESGGKQQMMTDSIKFTGETVNLIIPVGTSYYFC